LGIKNAIKENIFNILLCLRCDICCRQFDDFNISVSERACQWQLHRVSEHGDEDPPQGNIADIVSRIVNEKAVRKSGEF
jgi:hypothetical protein